IDATILRTTNALGLNIATKGDAFSETNGIKLWLMTNARLHELQGVLSEKGNEILARPRVVAADGVEGSMYIGSVLPIQGTNRNVGLEMSVFPRTRKSSTDLTLTLLSTEAVTNPSSQSKGVFPDAVAIQTNLAVVPRVQIPSGMGVLLISGAPAHNAKNPTNSGGIAVLVAVEAEKLNR
ncbi:MAG: hypothetical protein JWM99_2632, partial [Verrucomicrobiales bacterium]|nr:hypothetical protein [Verrucomicrobiales bacterium]